MVYIPDGNIEAIKLIHHGVECYGFILRHSKLKTLGFISDTRYDEEIIRRYSDCELLVVNMTFHHIRNGIDHLAVDHIALIRDIIAPKAIILNHFGKGVIEAGPEKIARNLTNDSCKVIAPFDGQEFDLEDIESNL